MKIEDKKKYMQMALDLAMKARDKTYPNPMVGSVIVRNSKVIGRGYHHKPGGDHSEINAIKNVKGSCSGTTMFVTLEPCDTYGKTPPCTKAIIDNGIKKVVIAMVDPNPLNRNKGIQTLRENGIDVEVGICKSKAEVLNKKYIKYIKTGLPYVTVKLAQSIDGRIAAMDGSSKWISSETSRKYVKNMRKNFDAVLIGSNTAIKDNPFLLDWGRNKVKYNRIIIDTSLKLPVNSNLVKTAKKGSLIIGTTELANEGKVKKLENICGIDIVKTRSKEKKVSLKTFFKKLAKRDIVNIFVEGGGEIVGSLLNENMVDEVIFFIAPIILGGNYLSINGHASSNISKAIRLKNIQVSNSDKDVVVRGEL